MTRVVISTAADADTDEILAFLIRHAGLATAARYNSLFETLYDRLAVHPDSGSPRPLLGENVRIGIVPPYIVIYEHDMRPTR
jgi:toxin ParE1/3/4